MMMETGKKAPSFTLKNQTGEEITLSDFKGRWVVLYFYPKDLTPGCTVEACDFTEAFLPFQKENAVVLGVSPDSVKSHQKFVEQKNLKITLLADENHAVCEKYGVWQLKKFMGKEFMGVVRSTFIIDPNGKVVHLWPKVRVAGHAKEVLEKLRELKARL